MDVHLSTDDGSHGHRGLVTELIRSVVEASPGPCRIVCCGPEAMMQATAVVADELHVPCQVSLESPMACGIGACFSCVKRSATPRAAGTIAAPAWKAPSSTRRTWNSSGGSIMPSRSHALRGTEKLSGIIVRSDSRNRREGATMAHTIVIFGASGDLTTRKLIPALYELHRKKRLPENTRIVGFSRTQFSHDAWRGKLAETTAQFVGKHFDAAIWQQFAASIFYQPGDIGNADDFPPLASFLASLDGGQNVLVLRFANSIFEPVWNRNYIDHVQITAAEDLTVGHRTAYYDGVGVLRNMFQNHLLQLMNLRPFTGVSAATALPGNLAHTWGVRRRLKRSVPHPGPEVPTPAAR